MARLGITLPNRDLEPGELDRILALGCRDYVLLHYWLHLAPIIMARQPDAHIHARIDERGPLGDPIEAARDTTEKCRKYGRYVYSWRRRNEVNLESPGVTPDEWREWLEAYLAELRISAPESRHNIPAPSPGVPGWESFIVIIKGHQNDAHAYGNAATVATVMQHYAAGSLITEWNFGAGREYPLEVWVSDLTAVLSDSTIGVSDALIVFIWDWKGADMHLPTPVNVKGTPMEKAIADWNRKESSLVPQIKGIDVASYQGNVDWQKVAESGRDFAFTKATEDTGYTNPYFIRNWKGIKAAGMARGAYHFLRGTSSIAQAEHFLDAVGDLEPGDMLALDVELPWVGVGRDARAWLDYVAGRVGFNPILYTNFDMIRSQGLGTDALAKYPLWLACYDDDAPDIPKPWTVLSFWQFSQDGQVSGVSGDVDEDIAFISRDRIHLLGKPKPVVDTTDWKAEAEKWRQKAMEYSGKLLAVRAVLDGGSTIN